MEALYSQITLGYSLGSSPQRPDGLSEEIVYSFGRGGHCRKCQPLVYFTSNDTLTFADDPQLWVIPPAISLLIVAQIFKEKLARRQDLSDSVYVFDSGLSHGKF